MAGLAGVTLRFNGPAPHPSEILAEAQRIGGMKLVVSQGEDATQTVVAFEAFPKDGVTIVSYQINELGIFDRSFYAPALYRLLWQASARLGGEPPCSDPLDLPLTERSLNACNKSQRRFANWAGAILVLLLVMVPLAVVVGIWWALRAMLT